MPVAIHSNLWVLALIRLDLDGHALSRDEVDSGIDLPKGPAANVFNEFQPTRLFGVLAHGVIGARVGGVLGGLRHGQEKGEDGGEQAKHVQFAYEVVV